jgi:hypothetical protein
MGNQTHASCAATDGTSMESWMNYVKAAAEFDRLLNTSMSEEFKTRMDDLLAIIEAFERDPYSKLKLG